VTRRRSKYIWRRPDQACGTFGSRLLIYGWASFTENRQVCISYILSYLISYILYLISYFIYLIHTLFCKPLYLTFRFLSRYVAKVVPVNEITDSKLSIFKIGKFECDINKVLYLWIFTWKGIKHFHWFKAVFFLFFSLFSSLCLVKLDHSRHYVCITQATRLWMFFQRTTQGTLMASLVEICSAVSEKKS
jgi:hypothetical protein